jgi:hypothetical protein
VLIDEARESVIDDIRFVNPDIIGGKLGLLSDF